MKDEIKAKFEKLTTARNARVEHEKQEEQKRKTEREAFEDECRRVFKDVIGPALQEVAAYLRPQGWKCDVMFDEKKPEIAIEIYQPHMTSVAAGQGRPRVTFSADRMSPTIQVWSTSRTQAGGQGTFGVAQATAETAQSHVLKFFERVANDQ